MTKATTTQVQTRPISSYIHIAMTLLLMFGFGLLPAPEPMTALGMKVIGIFLGLLYGWTTCGLIWPSLLGMMALALTGAMSIAEILMGGFGNETTLLILFLLIFAAAVEEAGVSRSIAMWFVTRRPFSASLGCSPSSFCWPPLSSPQPPPPWRPSSSAGAFST